MSDIPALRGMRPDRRDPRAAWLHFRRTLDADATARAIILNLAGTRKGRRALDELRRAWARHGLPAPFDALLREELGEETEEGVGRRPLRALRRAPADYRPGGRSLRRLPPARRALSRASRGPSGASAR